jgi:hypothetical protein
MRQSASRIRSLGTRYALAEAAAFPGIRTEQAGFPHIRKASVELKYGHPCFVRQA